MHFDGLGVYPAKWSPQSDSRGLAVIVHRTIETDGETGVKRGLSEARSTWISMTIERNGW